MSIKALDQQTGAQTSAVFNIGPVGGDALQTEQKRMRIEAFVTGTIAGITTAIEGSSDGTNFSQIAIGSAADTLVAVGSSNAPYVRVVTTGTGGPYDVDLEVARA